jgi:hypothetical protein
MKIHRIREVVVCAAAALTLVISMPAAAQSAQERALAMIEKATGLKPITIPETEGAYLGKTHRGYEVIYTAKAGNVWGRYVARLTTSELGRETGGLLAYMTGQRRSLGGNVVGSPLDQLLSEALGQPLSVTILLKHGKPNAPRFDVISDYAKVGPADRMQQRDRIGHNAGHLYSDDAQFAQKIAANEALMKRMRNLRTQYIRLDGDAVTFFFAGSETDYSGMMRDHGGFDRLLNDIMDDLADIADAIPAK